MEVYKTYGAWGSTVLLVGRSRDRIPVASITGIFLVDTDRTMCLGVNPVSKKWVPGIPLGGKGGRCVRLTIYHPCSAERQEIRGLNLPGPSWTISTACCGRDLYLYLYLNKHLIDWRHCVVQDLRSSSQIVSSSDETQRFVAVITTVFF